MPATSLTYTNLDTIKLFQYFRHFLVTKLGKILLTAKKISAKRIIASGMKSEQCQRIIEIVKKESAEKREN